MSRIVQFAEYGGPETLTVVERDAPDPGPGEIRVRTTAIGVGVPDILMRTGNYAWIPPLPVIPGNELSGVVEAVGEGVNSPQIGQRVYVNARELPQRGGCYADDITVPAKSAFPLPDSVNDAHAVSLGNYQLAWLLLNIAGKPLSGDRVLVHAAAGGAGSAVVQLGRRMGLDIIGVAGSADKARYVDELGANHVIDRTSDSIPDRVEKITDGTGVNWIYDAVGGAQFSDNFTMLAPLGTLVMFGHIAGWPDPSILNDMRARFGDSLGFRLFSIHVLDDRPELRRQAMEEAIAAMASGEALPRIHDTLPLEAAADAHRMLEAGGVTGKVVLVP